MAKCGSLLNLCPCSDGVKICILQMVSRFYESSGSFDNQIGRDGQPGALGNPLKVPQRPSLSSGQGRRDDVRNAKDRTMAVDSFIEKPIGARCQHPFLLQGRLALRSGY